jgi:Methyltransferase domain
LTESDPFPPWFEALERRHLSKLTLPEVRRSVQALSSLYVERRIRIASGSALAGAGKRAAFALFFGPLHFLLVREIVRALKASIPPQMGILDLGCGTGIAGAAWALEVMPQPHVAGVDMNSWVLEECKWTYRQLRIEGTTKKLDLADMRIPRNTAVITAFTINELNTGERTRFHDQLLQRTESPVLIVEPIARKSARWWDCWAEHITRAGGRADEWRFRVPLPERLVLLDRAAGLNHSELTGRSLWLPGNSYKRKTSMK